MHGVVETLGLRWMKNHQVCFIAPLPAAVETFARQVLDYKLDISESSELVEVARRCLSVTDG